MYKYLKGGYKRERARLLSVVASAKTRCSGHKLKHRRLPLNTRTPFCTERVAEHQQRLPMEVVESPAMELTQKLGVGLDVSA